MAETKSDDPIEQEALAKRSFPPNLPLLTSSDVVIYPYMAAPLIIEIGILSLLETSAFFRVPLLIRLPVIVPSTILLPSMVLFLKSSFLMGSKSEI